MNKRECTLCRENKGIKHFTNCHGNKAYVAQQSWNRKMARIFAQDGQQPIPEAPDYSMKAMEQWIVSQSVTKTKNGGEGQPNMWWREMHALLAKDPKPYRPTMPKGEVT